VLTAVAGVALWVGATVVGSPLTFPDALAGAFNTVPVTALGLGAAVLALGFAPGAVLPVGVLPGACGFLWMVVADSIDAPHWAAGVSPFTHLAAVPAVGPDVPSAVVMGVVALFLGCAGAMGYQPSAPGRTPANGPRNEDRKTGEA
jgi:ABC-2 type transport system permease protein